jgi:hypothetical protein
VHGLGADRLGTLAERDHELAELGAGLDEHGRRGSRAVLGALDQGGDGQVEVGGGLDVGRDVPQPRQLRDVGEAGEPVGEAEPGGVVCEMSANISVHQRIFP